MLIKILQLLPFSIALAIMIRCWFQQSSMHYIPQWQHYSAVLCALIVVYFLLKDLNKALIALGCFFVVGTCNGLSLTSAIVRNSITIFGVESPPFNSLSLGLLFLFFILNFTTIVNLYLDHKERMTNSPNN